MFSISMLLTSPFIYALLGGTLPALLWLFFWLREDKLHPEPRSLLVATFFGGALAVFAAIAGERATYDAISNTQARFILWAGIEEVVKLLAVTIFALNSSKNDEPIDAMIYCITAALGFSALENTLFIYNSVSSGLIAQSIATESMRFIGASLVHVVSSAFIGFTLGYSKFKKLKIRIPLVICGVIGATALHSTFNLSIINADPAGILKTFVWIWAAVVLLIVLFEEIKVVRMPSSA